MTADNARLWFRYTDRARYEDPEMLEIWLLKHLNFHTTYVSWEAASKLAYIEDGDKEGLYTDLNWNKIAHQNGIEGSKSNLYNVLPKKEILTFDKQYDNSKCQYCGAVTQTQSEKKTLEMLEW